jgi:hypothetical protein
MDDIGQRTHIVGVDHDMATDLADHSLVEPPMQIAS